MSVWRFSSVYFISIATILGTGILGLPVTLYNCGFLPFLVVFTVVLFAQLGVVFAFVELLQRTDVSLSKLTTELRPINTSDLEITARLPESSIDVSSAEQVDVAATQKKDTLSSTSVVNTSDSSGRPISFVFHL